MAHKSALWSANSPTAPDVDGSAFSWSWVASVSPLLNVSVDVQLAWVLNQLVDSPGVERRIWVPSASVGQTAPAGGAPGLHAGKPTRRERRPARSQSAG